MKKFLALLLAALLVSMSFTALAAGKVRTTASVNLREGPGLDYEVVTSLLKGRELEYLGKTSTDERGVDWYKVRWDGEAVWISSRYSVLSGAVDDDDVDDIDDGDDYMPDFGDSEETELSLFYLENLKNVALALDLNDYRKDTHSEIRNFYSNDSVTVGGNDVAEHFTLSGPGYTLFGVSVGMELEDARKAFTQAGLVAMKGATNYFQHPADENSMVNSDGFDSGISIVADSQGRVSEISWDSYTG